MLILVETETNQGHWYTCMLTSDEFRQFVTPTLTGDRHKKAWIGIVEHQAADRIQAICGKTMSK
jgi:hypothetical protein